MAGNAAFRSATKLTAVWTSPARLQINVCRPCLEEQVRAGEWEIKGARRTVQSLCKHLSRLEPMPRRSSAR
jgi:hypothetical protein